MEKYNLSKKDGQSTICTTGIGVACLPLLVTKAESLIITNGESLALSPPPSKAAVGDLTLPPC